MEDLNTKLLHALHAQAHKNRFVDALIVFCAQHLIIIMSFVFAGTLFFERKDYTLFFLSQTVCAVGVGLLLSVGLGFWFRTFRPSTRPEIKPLISAWGTWKTFPSDHTMIMFVYAGILALAGIPIISLLFILIGLIIGISRVMAGVHYPADIVGGALLGWLLGTTAGMVAQWIKY